jgi:glutathione reductase (NADPH)
MATDYDLFVIGGGSGGVRASRMAAMTGARVALAEEYRMGGTCVIRGCIPKKLLVYASHFGEDFENARGFGWTVGETSFDWPSLIAAKDREIARLEGLYDKNVKAAGVTVFQDRAVFEDAHTLRLVNAGKTITADKILIATGGRPRRDLGGDHLAPGAELCITSDEAFHLKTLPRRILIAGGGYIALEFAHIFHGLGSEVSLVYRGDKVLRGFDEDIRDALCDSMQKRGLRVLLGCQFASIEKHGDCLRATSNHGEVIEADQVMLAIGRVANTENLHIEKAGVELGKHGQVTVDNFSRSSAENIYAIGDVTDRVQLTPVAIHEAMCFSKTVFENKPVAPNYEVIPTAVFTTPEIGVVGLSEQKALASGIAVDVYKSTFRPLALTLTTRQDRMMMKLVVDRASDRVLGCHIFGPNAGDMIQLVAVALKMGATKTQFDATMALHPSAAEELVTMRTKSYSRDPVPGSKP